MNYSEDQISFMVQKMQSDKEKMLFLLNCDQKHHEKINELFNIDLKDAPVGREQLSFCKTVFKIKNVNLTIKKIEQQGDIDLVGKDKNGVDFIWTRVYPKGHWSLMSKRAGARQILGDIRINLDKTLGIETKTKSWMIKSILYVMNLLGKDIKLINLNFQNPLDLLKNKTM